MNFSKHGLKVLETMVFIPGVFVKPSAFALAFSGTKHGAGLSGGP